MALANAPAPSTARRSGVTFALVVLTAALIGGNYAALKEALEFSSPIMLTGLRTIIGGVFLLGFALLRGERLPASRTQLIGIFVVSLCITTISSTFLVLGVDEVTSGMAALLTATMPVFAALLAIVFVGESPQGRGWLGLTVAIGGTAVLASPALTGQTSAIGVLFMFVATFSWAVGTIVLKRWDFGDLSPVMLVALQLLMSAVVVTALGLVVEGTAGVEPGWGLAVPLGYAAIPAMAISFALMTTVVNRAPAVQAASTAYLIPVIGLVVGWLVRDEALLGAQIVGGALVVVGVAVLSVPGAVGPRARP